MAICRAAYLASFPFMPESLPRARRARADSLQLERRTLVQRLLDVPKDLVAPFKVLLPRKVDEGKRKDWRLLLVAISGALLLVDTVRSLCFLSQYASPRVPVLTYPPLAQGLVRLALLEAYAAARPR